MWAAAARGIQPIILSFGAALTALDLNVQPKVFDLFGEGWIKKPRKDIGDQKREKVPDKPMTKEDMKKFREWAYKVAE